jgi:hypothetical protein
LLSTLRSESGIRNMHEDRMYMCALYMENDALLIKGEEFEDTKRVIRIRKSKKDSQHNDQKYKRTNNDLQNIHIKLMID